MPRPGQVAADYWEDIKTRCRCGLGRLAALFVQTRLAVRQLEHGWSLSQRI